MSLQQEMIQITDNGLSTSQMEAVKYPILDTIIPQAQYIEMNDVKEAVQQDKEQSKCKEEFLIQYYKRILTQHGIILSLFIFGQQNWVMNIFVYSGYWYCYFRWTWYVNLIMLILILLGLPITRYYRQIVQQQNKIFHVQTILIGFLLISIAAYQQQNNHHTSTVWWIIITLLILISHNILQIFMIKKNVSHYYTSLMKFVIMGSIVLNFIVSLCFGYVDGSFSIAEGIIIYSLYYFNQLNSSLLNKNEMPNDVSFMERIKIINKIKQLFNQEAQQNQVIEQIKDTHCVINKYLAILIISLLAYILVVILSFVTGNTFFIVVMIITSVSILSLVLNTQVASKSLQDEDYSYAVCLTYLDLASPFKNLMRDLIP